MKRPLRDLWADILNRQVETAEEEDIEAALPRLAACARGEPWREEDIQLVWTSPTARTFYLAERRAVLAELRERWDGEGHATSFVRRAADSGAGDALVLTERGVTVRVLGLATGEWLVSVVLESAAQALLPPGTKVRLRDSGGLEWLLAEPDDLGGIDAPWEQPGESPVERLRAYSLQLDFA